MSSPGPSQPPTRLIRRSAVQAHAFIVAVCLAGAAVTVVSAMSARHHLEGFTTAAVLFTIGVVIGELFPLRVRRPGAEGEITPSTTFAFGLVLMTGFGAVPLLAAASAVCDRLTGKSLVKVAFNASQYALTAAAAAGVLWVLSEVPHVHASVPFLPADLATLFVAGVVWFAVNSLLVGTVVALLEQQSIVRCLSEDLRFQATSNGLLIGLAPMVVLSTDFSPLLLPLFVLPLLSIVQGQRQALQKEHEALHDALTGLPNRVLFTERVDWAIRSAAIDGDQAAVMLIDLDGFKQINDTLGHAEGDRLLVRIADRLRGGLRDGDVVARLGGDEFGVLAAGADRAAADALARRLQAELQRPLAFDELELSLGGSIGIALFPDHGEDVDALVQRADVAMYRAKRTRAGIAPYDPQVAGDLSRTAVEDDLERALRDGELVPYFQPKVTVDGDRVVGMEALVRWEHPERGIVPPMDFIGVAEQSGLITRLTEHVLEHALLGRQACAAAGMDLAVAVNLSARSLMDRRLPERIAAVLARTGAPPSALELEVTESMLMADPERAIAILEAVRDTGVTIAIDDFGTGHSSLERLRRLPVDTVKVDRSFIRNLRTDETDAKIVEATIDLSHHLGLSVVAEGIEDAETLGRLAAMGCDLGQGYHWSPPLTAAAFARWLAERRVPAVAA